GQHALGQRGAAGGALERVVEQPVDPRILGWQALFRKLEAAHDHGEDVVEVVGDAAGELSDGLHLLRHRERVAGALQRLLGAAAFADVADDLSKADRLAALVLHHANAALGPEPGAVVTNKPAFAGRLAFAFGVE